MLLSGEGNTDIGTEIDLIGPMSLLIDQWIEPRLGYSLIDTLQFSVIAKSELVVEAKKIKDIPEKGKKRKVETRFFFKNARALARIAKRDQYPEDIILVLFRDTDGTVSTRKGLWSHKHKATLDGFAYEGATTGVPMIPNPKSEAWILCALRNEYRHCIALENESGNDRSSNSLKRQLKKYFKDNPTWKTLGEMVQDHDINIEHINMPSMVAFKARLDEVLDLLRVPSR